MKVSPNPLGDFINEISEKVKQIIKDAYGIDVEVKFGPTKDRRFGDLTSMVCLKVARNLSKTKKEIVSKAQKIGNVIVSKLKHELIEKITPERGFLNIRLDYSRYNAYVLQSILSLREKFGAVNLGKNVKICVEYISANPIHPLHLGHARNAVIGEALARLYEFLGYKVKRRFYVDDMGKQVAYLVYGYTKLNKKPAGKYDHFFGVIYSCTCIAVKIRKIEEEIASFKMKIKESFSKALEYLQANLNKFSSELSDDIFTMINAMRTLLISYERMPTIDWMLYLKRIVSKINEIWKKVEKNKKKEEFKIITEVRRVVANLTKKLEEYESWLEVEREALLKWPGIYIEIKKKIADEDPEAVVQELMRKYEAGDQKVKSVFRTVCELVLQGFLETISKLGIKIDEYDWESDLVWSGLVNDVVKQLIEKGWACKDETGAIILDFRKAIQLDENIARIFNLDSAKLKKILASRQLDLLPPNLVLVRKDGTTLYVTRDIAYSIYKFRDGSEKVLNVIGADQKLAQQQVKAALYLLGLKNYAENLHHVLYELVILPWAKLSARRGRYITLDEIFEEARGKAYIEVSKRWPNIPEEEKVRRAEAIAIGAIKYALLYSDPEKVITFDWSRVLSFEENAGPFLQYAYARATSILEKAGFNLPSEADFFLLTSKEEKELIWHLSLFPEIVIKAAMEMKPSILAEYTNNLAKTFNIFYERCPVLAAEKEELKNARLLLVEAFRIVMRNALNLLGIPVLEKM